MMTAIPFAVTEKLRAAFAGRVQFDAPLARHTAARIGGPADVLLVVESVLELSEAVQILWEEGAPFRVLGAGSNVLVSDRGVRGVVLINKARGFRFFDTEEPPVVWAESGANLGAIARAAARKGFGGLEWAAGIPGTIGGAVAGNAGAHGGDMAASLLWADVIHQKRGVQRWEVDRLSYRYRSSVLKERPGEALVLAACLKLSRDSEQTIHTRMETFLEHRRKTQPPGASMGSMFKNPPGDFAGRLIDKAGLKGFRIGGAEISRLHANFFLNQGEARAADVLALIRTARDKVAEMFDVHLELEIELLGEWPREDVEHLHART